MREFFNRHAGIIRIGVPLLAVAIFIFAFVTFVNSQNQKQEASKQAQQAILDHTETLDQLKDAVNTLKANNQVNHDTTIKYIQCVIESFGAGTQTQIEQAFNACTLISGVNVGTK